MKETSFSRATYVLVTTAIVLYTAALVLLDIDPLGAGLFFVSLFVFLLWSVLFIIKDTDDPFEYGDGAVKPDEVSFEVLYQFGNQLKNRLKLPKP